MDSLIDALLIHRQGICHQYALTVDHQHCIGCALVMDHMHKNFPHLAYGTEDQWVEESAFCVQHERDIIKEYLQSKGLKIVQEK